MAPSALHTMTTAAAAAGGSGHSTGRRNGTSAVEDEVGTIHVVVDPEAVETAYDQRSSSDPDLRSKQLACSYSLSK